MFSTELVPEQFLFKYSYKFAYSNFNSKRFLIILPYVLLNVILLKYVYNFHNFLPTYTYIFLTFESKFMFINQNIIITKFGLLLYHYYYLHHKHCLIDQLTILI